MMKTLSLIGLVLFALCVFPNSASEKDRGAVYKLDIKAEDLRRRLGARLTELENKNAYLRDINIGMAEIDLQLLSHHQSRNEETFKLYMRALSYPELEQLAFDALLIQFGTRYYSLMQSDNLVGPNSQIFERKLTAAKLDSVQEDKVKLATAPIESLTSSLQWTLAFLLFASLGTAFGGKVLPTDHPIPAELVSVSIIAVGLGFSIYWTRILDTLAVHLNELVPLAFDKARNSITSHNSLLNPFVETFGYGDSVFTDSILVLAPCVMLAVTLLLAVVWSGEWKIRIKLFLGLVALAIFVATTLVALESKLVPLVVRLCPSTYQLKMSLLHYGTWFGYFGAVVIGLTWRARKSKKTPAVVPVKEVEDG